MITKSKREKPAPAADDVQTKQAKQAKARRGSEAVGPAAVNLLSPWVLEELHVVRLRRRFVASGVALVLALALLWSALTLRLHQNEEEARGEEDVLSALSVQIDDLDDVRAYISTVENRGLTAAAMADAQAQMARAMETLSDALPRQAEFESMSLVLASDDPADAQPAEGSTCPGPDPFGTTTVIGCVTLSGTADSRADVAKFVQRLAESPLFIEPFVETTTRGTERGVAFTGSVALTPDARHGTVQDDEPTANSSEEGS